MTEELLTKESFEKHVGSVFRVTAGEVMVEFRLEEVTAHPQYASQEVTADGTKLDARIPFSIAFSAPKEYLLSQALYPVSHPEMGDLQLFLKPYHENPEHHLYEAVFN